MARVRIQGLAAALLVAVMGSTNAATPQTSQQFFVQLRSSGGVTPFAQIVCFPDPGQGREATFVLVADSKDLASTLRAKGRPVPEEFVVAETAAENDQFVLEWQFDHGVRVNKNPETLGSVLGSNAEMWTDTYQLKGGKMTLNVNFAKSGRYTRNVFVDGKIAKSIYGQCQPVDYDFGVPIG